MSQEKISTSEDLQNLFKQKTDTILQFKEEEWKKYGSQYQQAIKKILEKYSIKLSKYFAKTINLEAYL